MRRERIQAQLDDVMRRLQMYYEAEAAILNGAQSYNIGSRQVTRAALGQIQREIEQLEKRRDELENMLENPGVGRRRSFRILLRDL